MTVKIDPDDPRVKILAAQVQKALAVPQRVENAVLPIYFPLRADSRPEQIASGVAVTIGGQFFVFSASHVFDDIGNYQLLLGIGNRLLSIPGERFSTAQGPSGTHIDDPIDASVFHIQSGVPDEFERVALSYDDFDSSEPGESDSVFLVSGFRANESKTVGSDLYAIRERYPSGGYRASEYSSLKLDENVHIAIGFEDKVLVGKSARHAPSLKGVSGGAIIRVEGVTFAAPLAVPFTARQRLTAIVIEHRRKIPQKPSAVVGTRIKVHLGLIRQYLPSLKFV